MAEQLSPEQIADYRARCYVNGVRKHGRTGIIEPASGEFSERFLPHPWVRESVTEGWGVSCAHIRADREAPADDGPAD